MPKKPEKLTRATVVDARQNPVNLNVNGKQKSFRVGEVAEFTDGEIAALKDAGADVVEEVKPEIVVEQKEEETHGN